MAVEWTNLRSKVARRLLLLFMTCTLLPIGALSLLAYQQVTDELDQQAARRLHQASKASGLAVLAQLRTLEARLVPFTEALDPAGPIRPRPATLEAAVELADAFSAIAWVGDGAEVIPLLGTLADVPEPGPEETRHLAAGKTWLATQRRADDTARILMTRRLRASQSPRIVAEIRTAQLLDFSHETTLPPGAGFCVLDDAGGVITCSGEIVASLPTHARGAIELSTSGRFEWTRDGVEHVAGYWALFLKPQYLLPHWTLAVSQPKSVARAPIASFRAIFPAASLLVVLLSSLLGVSQIRRRLRPLEQLHRGTRQIADQDFDVRVDVRSGDEFEEMASSFNAMANRLGDQFKGLSTMIEIDRAILGARDAANIVGILLDGVAELYPCDLVAITVTDRTRRDFLPTFVKRQGASDPERIEVTGISAGELDHFGSDPHARVIPLDGGAPSYLAPLATDAMKLAIVLPLVSVEQVFGIIAIGHADGDGYDAERLVFVRQLADQAAVALANARAVEDNRVLAYYDSLTGLPNRLLLHERLGQALLRARRYRKHLAVCILDLDGFKRINDTLGHDAGDELLKSVGERISRSLRNGCLGRQGGDEFTILLADLDRISDAARVADRVGNELARPFRLGDREVFITASIGIAVFPEDGADLESLVKNADIAMYHAKEQGRNNFQFYSASMNDAALERLTLEHDLRGALERDEFEVYYQPIVDVDSRAIIGMEALVRWQHPELGLIPPASFIPIAEETALIVPLGEWVLRSACAQAVAWQRSGFSNLRVSVNLSPRQFGEPLLLDKVKAVLEATELCPRYLDLEITESLLMHGEGETVRTLKAFKRMGVRLSIDDFGTGYSSLDYLKHFPVDILKIDRSFIQDLETDASDAAITRAVVALGHSLNLVVVAEGVTSEAQLGFLRALGCDAAQGFLFGRPVPPDEFEKLLTEHGQRDGAEG